MNNALIELRPHFFQQEKLKLAGNDAFDITAFRYSTGVCGLRIANSTGYIDLLPFHGQQIWRANFLEHDLVMKSNFEEPASTTGFEDSYGGFLIHCGLTAIGNPSSEDTHDQHGELPNGAYERAYIILGEDSRGKFASLCGEFSYNKSDADYLFCPECRLYEDATTFEVTAQIKNRAKTQMEYFYLCHINFRPEDGAKLIYSAAHEDIFVHHDTFDNLSAEHTSALDKYLTQLENEPDIQDSIDRSSQIYDPEIVFTVKYKADENGNAYNMQILPDGNAHYVRHCPSELPFGIRWISRSDSLDAIGMVLPATAEHKGYLYCKKNKQERFLAPDESISFHMEAGILPKEQVAQVSDKIRAILQSK